MTRPPLLLGAALIGLFAGCDSAPPPISAVAAADTTSVRADIDAAMSAYYAARAANDPVSAAAIYADDAILMAHGGEDVRGRAALEAHFRAAGSDNESQWRRDVLYVHGNRAYEAWYGSSQNKTTGQRAYWKWILFWRQDSDGRWRIERDLTASDALPR